MYNNFSYSSHPLNSYVSVNSENATTDNIEVTNNDPILKNINEEDTFYFLHSYFFDVKNKSNIIATTKYEIEIPIFVKKNKFYGVQFHPEKSQNSGIKIIDNFLKIS